MGADGDSIGAELVCGGGGSGGGKAGGGGGRGGDELLIMGVVGAPLHFAEVVCVELILHLTHLGTEVVLVGFACLGFERVVLEKELFEFV